MSRATKKVNSERSKEKQLEINKKVSIAKLKYHPLRGKTFEESYGEEKAAEIKEKQLLFKTHIYKIEYENIIKIGEKKFLKEKLPRHKDIIQGIFPNIKYLGTKKELLEKEIKFNYVINLQTS